MARTSSPQFSASMLPLVEDSLTSRPISCARTEPDTDSARTGPATLRMDSEPETLVAVTSVCRGTSNGIRDGDVVQTRELLADAESVAFEFDGRIGEDVIQAFLRTAKTKSGNSHDLRAHALCRRCCRRWTHRRQHWTNPDGLGPETSSDRSKLPETEGPIWQPASASDESKRSDECGQTAMSRHSSSSASWARFHAFPDSRYAETEKDVPVTHGAEPRLPCEALVERALPVTFQIERDIGKAGDFQTRRDQGSHFRRHGARHFFRRQFRRVQAFRASGREIDGSRVREEPLRRALQGPVARESLLFRKADAKQDRRRRDGPMWAGPRDGRAREFRFCAIRHREEARDTRCSVAARWPGRKSRVSSALTP